MAHDFVKKIVEGRDRSSRGGVFFFGLGGSLLITALLSRWFYGDDIRSYLVSMIAALFMGTPLIVQTAKELWQGKSEMNELAALGVLATFVSGRFITSGLISFVMIISALLESRSAMGARESLEALISLKPPSAWLKRNGSWIQVTIEELKKDDFVRVRPGERFPVDGVISEGHTAVDESTVTGESIPVERGSGDPVYAGTVNITGVVLCRVVSVGEETALGRVQSLISEAEATRTPVMKTIDKYAGWYVPVVMLFAGAALFITRDLDRAVSMLVVACPCSILLSGPTAVVAALGAAARLGILIKDIAYLEIAEKLSSIVFDKTGTITSGVLRVVDIVPSGSWSQNDLLARAYSLEKNSTHPIARSICSMSQDRGLESLKVSDIEEVHGSGVSGYVQGSLVMVGRRVWLEGKNISVDLDEELFGGKSLLFMAIDGEFAGAISLEDSPRPESFRTLRELEKKGVSDLIILSGDRKPVVQRIAGLLKIDRYKWEMLPHEKMDFVNSLKDEGSVVGVVGDGVNDGPALSAGDLSIAMGAAGSDVAISSASIALMNDDITRIPMIVDLSKGTLRVIRQNLLFAFSSIGLSMLFGALGLLHPVTAAVLHGGTSLAVVLNSARIVRFSGVSDDDPSMIGKENLSSEG